MNYVSWNLARPVQGVEFYDIALKHTIIDKNYYPDDSWNIYGYLKIIDKRTFNQLFKSVRFQQAIMLLILGNIELKNYKGNLREAKTIILGIRKNKLILTI